MKKNILLSGFLKSQTLLLKRKFKTLKFIKYKKGSSYKNLDAFVSINRMSFEDFYKNDFDKLANKLKWIHVAAAGLDVYPKLLRLGENCKVTNGKIIQGPEVADHAMALLLGLTRNIYQIAKFGQKTKFFQRPVELKEKKMLIVGYGGVGRCLAERAISFGMKVSVLQKSYSPISNQIDRFYLFEQYSKAVKDKDVVVYTLPLTSKTKKMYNYKVARDFKKGAIIINVCRGDVVCKKTLYKNLKNKKLGGAGVDVIEGGDLLKRNDKFFKLKNFIFTPHIAGISDNLKFRNFELIKQNLTRFSKNQNLNNVIIKSELK